LTLTSPPPKGGFAQFLYDVKFADEGELLDVPGINEETKKALGEQGILTTKQLVGLCRRPPDLINTMIDVTNDSFSADTRVTLFAVALASVAHGFQTVRCYFC